MPKFGMLNVKEQRHFARLKWWKYNFDIEVKGQGPTEFMNVRYTLYHGDTLTCQTKFDYVKGLKSWDLNTKPCHKPYKVDLEVKVQGRIRIVTILDASFHGDRPMCQIWYANAKANRRPDMKTWQKPINLTLRSKVNIESGSWMYATDRLIVIHLCAKYGKPMSIKKSNGPDTKTCQKTINFTWRSKFKSYLDHEGTRHIVLWCYTHVPNMITNFNRRKSYGPDTNLHRQTDGQTDGQTEWFLYTPRTSFTGV